MVDDLGLDWLVRGLAVGVAVAATALLVPATRRVAPALSSLVAALLMVGQGLADALLLVGVALLVIVSLVPTARAIRWPTTLVGAGAVAADATQPATMRFWFTLAAVSGAAGAFESIRRSIDSRTLASLLLVTLVGVYLAVPDTERILMVGGVFAPTLLLAMASRPASIDGLRGLSAAAGLIVWTAVTAAEGRPAAALGAVACLGVLLSLPAVSEIRRRLGLDAAGTDSTVLLLAVQLPTVAVASRVAARQAETALAALIATAAVAAGALALLAVRPTNRWARTRHPAR